jgi:hypothetical protein
MLSIAPCLHVRNAKLPSEDTQDVHLHTGSLGLGGCGSKDYEQAAKVALELVDSGVKAIELCGGFGQIGVGKVDAAVGERAFVGAVRFDRHPGLGYKSGDELFVK